MWIKRKYHHRQLSLQSTANQTNTAINRKPPQLSLQSTAGREPCGKVFKHVLKFWTLCSNVFKNLWLMFEHLAAKRSKIVANWTLCGKLFKHCGYFLNTLRQSVQKFVVDFWTLCGKVFKNCGWFLNVQKMWFIFEHVATRCSKTCGCTIYVVCIH